MSQPERLHPAPPSAEDVRESQVVYVSALDLADVSRPLRTWPRQLMSRRLAVEGRGPAQPRGSGIQVKMKPLGTRQLLPGGTKAKVLN